ncbi:MAG: hypothetical protein JNL82_25270 [Myxococcales bacterium]|nr:hypothetical protein [Myxococcales bacterium]
MTRGRGTWLGAALVGCLALPGPARAGEDVRALLRVASERVVPLSARSGAEGRGFAKEVRHRGFSLHGLPVRGAYATVLDGEVVSESLPREPPELLPAQAAVTASEARLLAHAHANMVAGVPVPAAEQDGELVYLTILGVPVLAYQVEMPLTLAGEEPSRKTVWVSANSGIVLDEWEHVRSSKARVFLNNPAVTPDPVEVTFSGLHAEGPGVPMNGDRVLSFGCALEDPGGEPVPWYEEGKCWPVQTALSDENGDYFVPLPNILHPDDNRDGDDAYAEVSMYWHAERFVDQMKKEGVDEFKCDVSTMWANYRTPKLSPSYPDLPYTPLNNAYWTNTCDPEDGATMIFGQGSDVDFGYDGEVVYHELGHGMVSLLTPEGLGRRRERPDGLVADAGGINEAVADYFSVMVANDPELGDYVARFWPGYGSSIRSAENKKSCPDDLVGQVHNDGEPLMAALWAARKRVGQDKLDPLVIEMLTRLPADADLETAAWTLYDLANEEFGAGRWTETDLEFLVRAFDERGLYECERVIEEPSAVAAGRSMYLRQKGTAVTPFYPGPMQMRAVVPDGSDNLIVQFRLSRNEAAPPDNPTGVVVLLKRADAPIEFKYSLTAVDKANGGAGKPSVREVVAVEGDWDLMREASLLGSTDNQLVIRGFRPGEVVYVTMATLLSGETVPGSLRIVSVPPEFLDDGTVHVDVDLGEEGETDTDTDGGSSGDWTDPEVDEEQASASCACDGAGGIGGTALLLPLLALRRRRR